MTSLGPDQTTALRRLLIDTVEQPAPSRSPRRPLIPVLVAAPLTAILVVGFVLSGAGTPSASAADALRLAAGKTITVSDPVVGPGQYLRITTYAAYLAYEVDERGRYSAYLSPSSTEVFVPANPGSEWVQRTTAEPATAFFGSDSHAAYERDRAATLADGPVQVTRSMDGDFVHAAELGGAVPERTLPRQPEAALEFLRDTPDPSDIGALAYAAQLLRGGTMSAADRAVLYRALALLPGIRISDGEANLNGRTGIAFSLQSDVETPEIIVDPDTGEFIGERTLTRVTQDAVPAGTVSSYTAVSTDVVESAP